MRHNLFFDAADLACLVSLGALFGVYVLSRRLWRSPLTWLCLALVATIIYGVTCSYTRIYQIHHLLQIVVSQLGAWFAAGQHSPAPPHWIALRLNSLQLQKAGHVILFALLPIAFGLLVWQRQRRAPLPGPRPWWRPCLAYLGVFAGLTIFATAAELLQFVTPEREPKVADWLLNLKGLGIGMLLLCLFLGLVGLGARLFARWRRRVGAGTPAPGHNDVSSPACRRLGASQSGVAAALCRRAP